MRSIVAGVRRFSPSASLLRVFPDSAFPLLFLPLTLIHTFAVFFYITHGHEYYIVLHSIEAGIAYREWREQRAKNSETKSGTKDVLIPAPVDDCA